MKHFLLAALLALLPGIALAQGESVQQSGQTTPGHPPMFITNGVIGDAGSALNGKLKEVGITNTGTPFCINDAPITGPYHQLCMGSGVNGRFLISANGYGGATAQPLTFNINGVSYDFPGTGLGNVLGLNTSCVGCLAYFGNTRGSLLYSLPALVLTQSGMPQPGRGLAIDVTSTLAGSYSAGPTTANLLHLINTGVQSGTDNFTSTLLIMHEFGGAAVTGGQNSIEVDGYFDKGPTSPTNGNRNYVGGFFQMAAYNGDGGTDPSSFATSKGAIFGIGTFGDAKAGIAFTNVTGGEFDVALEAGTSTLEKTGLQIVSHQLDAGHGTYIDTALAIGAQMAAAKFNNAILLSNGNGAAPLTTIACVICTTANNESIATGIDLSSYYITGFFLKSNGFWVSGAGAVSGSAYFNAGAHPAGAVPAATTSSFWSNNMTGGGRESDFVNLDTAGNGFNFYQQNGAASMALIASVEPGVLAVPNMVTSCAGHPSGTLINLGGVVNVCP